MRLSPCCFSLAASTLSRATSPSWGGGNYLKTIALGLSDASTKADASTISDATLFVFSSQNGGDEFLYRQIYTESPSSVTVDLLFSDQVDYTYVIRAYGNMGELSEEPEEGDVLFSNESPTAFQCRGTSAVLGSGDAVVSIGMERYVSRVSVSSINLDMYESYESASFVLKRAWLAQVPSAYSGGTTLNADGTHTATSYSDLLYCEPAATLSHGQQNSTDLSLYCYGPSAKLVLECSWNDLTQYYTVSVSGLSDNSGADYTVNIYQLGSTTPLGDLQEAQMVAAKTGLGMNAFLVVPDDASYGFNGARIQHVDGTLYTAEQWSSLEASGAVADSQANGVAVSDGEHAFVMHPSVRFSDYENWSHDEYLVPGCTVALTNQEAVYDFSGLENTVAIIAAVQAGEMSGDIAAEFCFETVFSDGSRGYLASGGQLSLAYSYYDEINECLSWIGGLSFDKTPYWSSTQRSKGNAWHYHFITSAEGALEDGESTAEYGKPFIPVCPLEPVASEFTIDGSAYTYEVGMTWQDWLDSEYNTGGFYTDGNYICVTTPYIVYRGDSGLPCCLSDVIFGDFESNVAPLDAIPAGCAMIYGIDKKFYTAEQWTAFGKSGSDAVGVAVRDGEHSFVIHPTAEQSSICWSNNTSVVVSGVVTTTDRATAQADFAGAANTAAILAAVEAGTIENAPAAQYAAGITFANGNTGYLPSAGELTLAWEYIDDINSCLSAIGGTTFSMESNYYWSSTQSSSSNAWGWYYSLEYVVTDYKFYNDSDYCARVVSALATSGGGHSGGQG